MMEKICNIEFITVHQVILYLTASFYVFYSEAMYIISLSNVKTILYILIYIIC